MCQQCVDDYQDLDQKVIEVMQKYQEHFQMLLRAMKEDLPDRFNIQKFVTSEEEQAIEAQFPDLADNEEEPLPQTQEDKDMSLLMLGCYAMGFLLGNNPDHEKYMQASSAVFTNGEFDAAVVRNYKKMMRH